MIASLNDRVKAIYEYVDPLLTKDSFRNINTKEDMDTEEYLQAKKMLEEIKYTTGVMYLYTAKENNNGELVYVIDGLSSEEDFRYPGDKIEPEIEQDLRKALAGEVILPKSIKITDWGKIFITYLPIHGGNGDEVLGAIGIEFSAEHQYNTYRSLQILTPIISFLFCLFAILIAILIFRRISNPFYQDMANTDYATKLKNRNAFELDIKNLNARNNLTNIGIISIDLNNLKSVNDNFGHDAGDTYIKNVAEIMKDFGVEGMIAYRVGGDEFAVIMKNSSNETLQKYLNTISKEVDNKTKVEGISTGISCGFALYCQDKEKDLYETYKYADQMMYAQKRKSKILTL